MNILLVIGPAFWIILSIIEIQNVFVIHHTDCGMEFFTKSGKLLEIEEATKAGAQS